MADPTFPTPDFDEPHPLHPGAHHVARMFFRCLEELPDSAWNEVERLEDKSSSPRALVVSKRARCRARGLLLDVESIKSATQERPYCDARWTERATFLDEAPDGKATPLARIEISGEGKFNPDAEAPSCMARQRTSLSITAFDPRGRPAQMGAAHWAKALESLDLEGSFGDALDSLRDGSERLCESFVARVAKARSTATIPSPGSDDPA